MRSLKNNKTPGNDGLPAEFYKMFWSKLGNTVFQTILQAVKNNQLHQSARHGMICLIPKKRP